MSVEPLPPELLQHILAMACCDDGATVSAARSTSKAFRDCAEHLRFRSVALTSNKQVAAFLDASAGSAALVVHLFLSLGPEDPDSALVTALLRAVSPTLETLHCIVDSGAEWSLRPCPVLAAVAHTPLPRLTHLTFRHRAGPVAVAPGRGALYPALAHLHVSFAARIPLLNAHMLALALAPPRLEGVCLSNVELDVWALSSLTAMLSMSADGEEEGERTPLLLPGSVERYVLIPSMGFERTGFSTRVDGLDCFVLDPEPLRTLAQWREEWLEMLRARYMG
ncbi:hypothetical protein NEOLEDRAFT_1184390 [Neolentinus lepideus HHB14362 ss-1]|uniref:F-box domain-containing protein n=1 Tax=Neolentinus lepideus HHB14362 ss-1 TaxID=1314782 RepID=A0A165MGY3_9AGAM|nr:hypothetical protein NEOLEDRAFT_1184390 [Neolentinus lepideus HHB14362 ss-1]